ncbi:alcohol dehydrogenase catalytic domain-containing protein, partial [Escherichia coli]|nr:alcohol dehydrogenase catalytic domain-containing protein [Escherichia coli]
TKPTVKRGCTRGKPGQGGVKNDSFFGGVCLSDVPPGRFGWEGSVCPCVTGHELVGRVVAVGDQVEKYAQGDLVGVGCIVDSCKHCEECEDGLENYCDHMNGTYNTPTLDETDHTSCGDSQWNTDLECNSLRI